MLKSQSTASKLTKDGNDYRVRKDCKKCQKSSGDALSCFKFQRPCSAPVQTTKYVCNRKTRNIMGKSKIMRVNKLVQTDDLLALTETIITEQAVKSQPDQCDASTNTEACITCVKDSVVDVDNVLSNVYNLLKNNQERTGGLLPDVSLESEVLGHKSVNIVLRQTLNLLEWHIQILQSCYDVLSTQIKNFISQHDAETELSVQYIAKKIETAIQQTNILKEQLFSDEFSRKNMLNLETSLSKEEIQNMIVNIWEIFDLVARTFHHLLTEQQKLSNQTLLKFSNKSTTGTQTNLKLGSTEAFPCKSNHQCHDPYYYNLRMKIQKIQEDKDSLKQAVRVQKERADALEETVVQIKKELMEKNHILHQLAQERDRWKSEVTRMANEKIEMDLQFSIQKRRVSEMETLMQTTEKLAKTDLEELNSNVQSKEAELTQIQSQNELLESEKKYLEERVKHLELEIENLKKNNCSLNNEAVLMEPPTLIEKADKCVGTDRIDIGVGTEDLTKLLSGGPKYENYASYTSREVQTFITGDIIALHENRSGTTSFQKRGDLSESSSLQNFELMAKQDALNLQYRLQLDQKQKENENLYHQLEETRANFQRQLREIRESMFLEDHLSRNKVTELEKELAQKKEEIRSMMTDKMEMEQRMKNKIHDLERNLELMQSTKNDLQNHLFLIRNSYMSMFPQNRMTATSLSQVARESYFGPFW